MHQSLNFENTMVENVHCQSFQEDCDTRPNSNSEEIDVSDNFATNQNHFRKTTNQPEISSKLLGKAVNWLQINGWAKNVDF